MSFKMIITSKNPTSMKDAKIIQSCGFFMFKGGLLDHIKVRVTTEQLLYINFMSEFKAAA